MAEHLLKHPLWAHQKKAADKMRGSRADMLLAWMGTGKTAICIERVLASGSRKWLVVCPRSVVKVWVSEFEKHAASPVDVVPLTGPVAARAREYSGSVADGKPLVMITNYEGVWRAPLGAAIKASPPDGVIWDEAQKLSSPSSKVSIYARDLRKRVPAVVGLSGTLPNNDPVDLYAAFRAIDPGIFGTNKMAFLRRYFHLAPGPHPNAPRVLGELEPGALAKAITPVTTRIGPEVLDLPPVTVSDRFTDLTQSRAAYDELERELIAELSGGMITADNALVKALRLRQIASGTVRTEDGGEVELGREKEALLAETLSELPPEAPSVVFANFRSELAAVKRAAGECYELSGEADQLARWRGNGGVLACQIQAGGVGVDMSAARYCIFFSLPYSRGAYDQAISRLHRPGQEHPVTVVRLFAAKTIDVAVGKALRSKGEKIADVLKYLG